MDDRAVLRVLDRVAEAVRESGTDEVLDDVELQRSPADVRPEVRTLGGRAVLQVGVRQSADVPHGRKRGERPHRLLGDQDLVGAADQLIGRVLADVTDGGDASGEGAACVLEPRREPDHVVAHMRLDRHGVREA